MNCASYPIFSIFFNSAQQQTDEILLPQQVGLCEEFTTTGVLMSQIEMGMALLAVLPDAEIGQVASEARLSMPALEADINCKDSASATSSHNVNYTLRTNADTEGSPASSTPSDEGVSLTKNFELKGKGNPQKVWSRTMPMGKTAWWCWCYKVHRHQEAQEEQAARRRLL